MTKALNNLLARSVSQARLLGLRSVVPHALFVVTHQALGEVANQALRVINIRRPSKRQLQEIELEDVWL